MNNKTKVISLACAIFGVAAIIIAFILMNNTKYTVTFDSDGGTLITEQVIKKGEMVSKPVNPVKEGYSFVRWDYQNREYDFTSPVSEDMTLKAIWDEVITVVKYKVSFTVGDVVKEMEISDFSDVEIDSLGFDEKDGFEIVWYVDGEEYDFTKPLKEDVKLEGKYVKVETVTVKFNSNGGTKVDNQKVKKGEKVIEPRNVTKYGFILDGWYINSKKYDFNEEVTKGITLYAKWKEDTSIPRYTVKFDSNKGSNVSSQKVIENQTATAPKNPTRSGYKFVEWQLNGKKYDFKTKVSEDITLKAVWKELAKYTVKFDSDGGSGVSSSTVTEGSTVSKPADPKKDGYTFKEWQLDEKTFDFKTKITKNITLKAVYTVNVNKYTVTFDSGIASQTVEEGKLAKKPADPKKDGYTFKGWKTSDGTPYTFTEPVKGNVSLTAIWEKVEVKDEYTITATRVDAYSPDSILKVFKNNSQISVKEIKYNDGVHLCNGDNLVVTTHDLDGENTFIVVLNDGTSVKATLK